MKRYAFGVLLLTLMFLISGCASVISRETLQQVDTTVDFKAVFEKPEAYRGVTVLWGGTIASVRNLKEGTMIEVVQKPLGYASEPLNVDNSGGRFLALHDGYLDSVVYSKGREITIAGIVNGSRKQKLDEIEYTYPLIHINEVYLWEERTEVRPEPYFIFPYPYRYYPPRYHHHR